MILAVGKGYITQIDEEDYEKVFYIRWRVIKSSISQKPYVYHPSYGMMSRMVMNTPEGMDCDHINGDTLDNRKQNLRNCTKSQNLVNQPKYIGKSSVFKGVSWYPNQQKWRARINKNGRTILLGYFITELEAAVAYNNAAAEIYGSYATLNDV